METVSTTLFYESLSKYSSSSHWKLFRVAAIVTGDSLDKFIFNICFPRTKTVQFQTALGVVSNRSHQLRPNSMFQPPLCPSSASQLLFT